MKKHLMKIFLLMLLWGASFTIFSQNKDVQKYYNSASNFYINNKNDVAMKEINKGLKIDPNNKKLKELAKKILENNKKKDEDKDKDKDKNKENKDKNKEQQKKEENKNKENKEKEKKQKQEQQKVGISKEEAQKMLDALQNDEKNIQDKLQKGKKVKGIKAEIEKDW